MISRCPYANHDQVTAHILYTLAVVFVSVAGVYAQQASEPAIGLKADRVLQDMSDYLARSDRFGVAAQESYDEFLDPGYRVQLSTSAEASMSTGVWSR